MKFCNYCGNPITEPSRFCSKCGARLPVEFTGEAMHSTPVPPQSFIPSAPFAAAQPGPFIVSGSSGKSQPQEPISNPSPQVGPPKVLIGILLGVSVPLVFLLAILLSPSKGITGTWTMDIDMNELITWAGESEGAAQEEIDMVTGVMTATGMDQVTVTYELNEDNTLKFILTMGEGTISSESIVTGTYDVLSDDMIRICGDEMTTRVTAFGMTQTETEDKDSEMEINYRLDGNTLTFIHDDIELQFKRS